MALICGIRDSSTSASWNFFVEVCSVNELVWPDCCNAFASTGWFYKPETMPWSLEHYNWTLVLIVTVVCTESRTS